METGSVKSQGHGTSALPSVEALTPKTKKKLGTPSYTHSPEISAQEASRVPSNWALDGAKAVAASSNMVSAGLNSLRNREIRREVSSSTASSNEVSGDEALYAPGDVLDLVNALEDDRKEAESSDEDVTSQEVDEVNRQKAVLMAERDEYTNKMRDTVQKSHAAIQAVPALRNLLLQCAKKKDESLLYTSKREYPIAKWSFNEGHTDEELGVNWAKPSFEIAFDSPNTAERFKNDHHNANSLYITRLGGSERVVAHSNETGGPEFEKVSLENELLRIFSDGEGLDKLRTLFENLDEGETHQLTKLFPGLSLKNYSEEELRAIPENIKKQLTDLAELDVDKLDLEDLLKLSPSDLLQLMRCTRERKDWEFSDLEMLNRIHSVSFRS